MAMASAIDRERLLEVAAIVDLLEAGWRPGNAELASARHVERWGFLPSHDGAPFRIIGFARSLPVRCRIFTAPIFAIDGAANWALTLDGWIVIGDALEDSPAVDTAAIRHATMAWLQRELRCLHAVATI